MKRTVLALVAFVGVALSAHASLVYSNSFDYPGQPGDLTTLSAGSPLGVWTAHSGGGNGPVGVDSSKATLTEAHAEDVNTVITNASFPSPFTTEILYASFKVNFSGLPSGAGGYFAHFKDESTSNFRCRVFAATNAAWGNSYRLGVQNGSSGPPIYVGKNLDLGTEYKVVLRFKGSTNSTMWVNPACEATLADTADAADVASNTYHGSTTFALRQSLSSGAGMGTLTFDDLLIGTAFSDVSVSTGLPTITAPANQSILGNTNTGPLAFKVDDCETPSASLVVTGTSGNPTLVPNNPANISFGGSGVNRTVTITLAVNQQGTTTIQLVVTDGDSLTATNSFQITVGAPSISAIAAQTTPTNTPTAAIPFTVYDNETPNSLTVSGTSSNPTLVQDTDISIVGTGANRTVQVTPQPDQAGNTIITLTVSDGVTSASTTFNLTVFPLLGLLLGDTFTYPDGDVDVVSGGFWVAHSGQDSNDCFVVNNQLRVSSTNAEDVHANFTNSAYASADSGMILFSKFTIKFEKLPSGSGGGYFAHYKDLATNFRAKVFAETNGAAAGTFRIGIANAGFTVAAVPRDLSLGTTYTVVTRYNVSTAQSTIWVNPHSESSEGALATDPSSPVEVDSYCFRQDGSSPTAGVILVDDLQVGTAFTDVIPVVTPPAAISLNIASSSGNAVLTWADPAFNLQSSPSLTGPWTTLWDAASGYSTPITPAQQYFRLFYYQ